MPYSRGSSQAWDRNQVSQIAGRFFPIWATREAQSLVKFMSTESVMLSNHLLFCHPLLVLSSIFPSIRVFSNELALPIRWPTIRSSASASVLPMSIYSWFPLGLTGLISLQSKELLGIFSSSKVSILGHSAFFMVQLSYLYMTTGNTIALTIQTFVSKVMSLLFNILYRFIIVFLIRSKCLLISWL